MLSALDFAILAIAGLAVLQSLRSQPAVSVRLSMADEVDVSMYDNGLFPQDHERLPLPIITDLDGDGVNEVVVVTHTPAVAILEIGGGGGGGSSPAAAAAASKWPIFDLSDVAWSSVLPCCNDQHRARVAAPTYESK